MSDVYLTYFLGLEIELLDVQMLVVFDLTLSFWVK
jgi:hypothetical protein